MASITDICNAAISHCGTRSKISSIGEGSAEANACQTHFALARDGLLRAFDWNFARLTANLATLQAPPARWAYKYAQPVDCLRLRRLNDTPLLLLPETFCELAADKDSSDSFINVILANASPVSAIYTAQVTDPNRWDPGFVDALSYDLAMRAMRTVGPGMKETHNLVATMGASAAAGCIAGLNAQQMRWMLGYTAQQSSGIGAWNRDTEHIQKAFLFGGMTARSGVTSALLVQAGWTGVDDIFSGRDNFFLAYNAKADPLGLIDKLGERYEVTRTNIKKWPVGSPIQAVLDALENLRAQKSFTAAQVKDVTVRLATNEAAIVNNREIPDICLQHVMAVALLDETITFASVHDNARLTDPGTLRARAIVRLVPDEELHNLMPLRAAIVDVTLVDGTHLSRRVDDVRGTPNNPMTRAEVVAKASDLIAPILGPAKCASLIERIFQLDGVRGIRELRPLLQRA